MKAILHVVLLLVVGVAAYFTIEHNRKFEELQKDRLQTTATNTEVTANAEAKETEVKNETKILNDSKQKREELTQSISALKSSGSSLERDLSELESTLKAQDEEFAELDKTMQEVAKVLKDLGADVTLDNLSEKIEAIQEDKKTKEVKLEELETIVAAATKKLANTRAEIDRMVKREIERSARIGRNSMEAIVSSVDQDWGFLVIGAGSNSGFTPQTSLIVQRNGQMIGRVRPSAIEPTQTVAEIDLNSMAPGVRIQPGDRVILSAPLTN